MAAFLLVWNPVKWPWPELPEMAQRVAIGEPVRDTWGCGVSRSLQAGDRVFVSRVAQAPKGLFASGFVTRGSYEVPAPDTRRGYRLRVELVYDWLMAEGVTLDLSALVVHPFSTQVWTPQSSGIAIKPMVEGPLEKLWRQRTR